MPKVYTTCVENSIICARAWYTQTGNPVRIAVTKVDPVNDIDHAQAQAQMNGIWTPLTEIWHPQEGKMEVVPWKPHFEIEPYRYLTLREWIDEQIQFAAPPIQL
jgi:hypothetical protein